MPTTDVLVSGVTYDDSGEFLFHTNCQMIVSDTAYESLGIPEGFPDTVAFQDYQPNLPACTAVRALSGGFADVIIQMSGSSTVIQQSANILSSADFLNVPTAATVTLKADPLSGYSFLDWRIPSGDSTVISTDPVLNLTGATLAERYFLELIKTPPTPPPPPPDTGSSTCFDPTQPSCNSTGN